MERMTKTAQALKHYKAGDLKRALSIFATFRIEFSKDEKRTIQIAHETLSGHGQFYESLGINTCNMIEAAKLAINSKYKL